MDLSLKTISEWTKGDLHGEDGLISSISTDTRKIQEGSLFIPIRGDVFDGHDFLFDAYTKGAAACLSEHSVDTAKT